MAGWLSCAAVVVFFHTLGWDSSHTRQLIFGTFVAYHSQPNPIDALVYSFAWKGVQYTLIGLVIFQGFQCLLPKTSTTKWTGPGKVLLFPCKTTHSRLFPKKHSFAYSYLVVGIPVGWEGVSGGLVSSSSMKRSWSSLSTTCRFRVDAADHLERGDAHLGLRGKLDAYLKSEVRAGTF